MVKLLHLLGFSLGKHRSRKRCHRSNCPRLIPPHNSIWVPDRSTAWCGKTV